MIFDFGENLFWEQEHDVVYNCWDGGEEHFVFVGGGMGCRGARLYDRGYQSGPGTAVEGAWGGL